ncbi:MAG TPA: NAD-dependent epimerase/dehydratase family protein [Oscillospiraceae bacterium]|nr:NAD-dependent epimerase/dehydratase family protein [Oscillospiraceae bacterium]HPF56614.1 NAD-dependent epimerase/dehydratase family protein [Clostridiales bacterium]HPK34359.1 NAD-dependent epimerase/dehydratase family protein [Oscillospiraceae bacterium]
MQKSKIYIVTGAFGHLGSTIVSILNERGYEVRGLALPGDSSPLTKATGTAKIYYGDVCDIDSLKEIFDVPQDRELIVIHAAGIVSIATKYNPLVQRVNVMGTRNIIKKCFETKAKRLVYVSSVHAIPELGKGNQIREIKKFDPEEVRGLYAKTKAEATQCVLDAAANGLDAVVVHPSGIIGPNDYGSSHTAQMIIDYFNGKLQTCVRGGYDFVDVRDVAEGTIAAAEKGKSGECYILSNRYCSVEELFDEMQKMSGRRKASVLPLWVAKMFAPIAELYYKARKRPPLYTPYSLYTLEANADFSHKKADSELGYKTRTLKQTLADTVAFLKQTGRIKPFKRRRAGQTR